MQNQNKFEMWNKVSELFLNGLTISQINRETGLSRPTIRHYLSMSANEFAASTSYERIYSKKLQDYEIFVKNELERCNSFSAAQIRDHLLEHFPHLNGAVCDKTIYNFVMMVRRKYSIEKAGKQPRDYCKVQETPYGKMAQIDFGEAYLTGTDSRKHKVYFFTMVLCRSRYKYVKLQNSPFTSATAVMAHHEAFMYFGGMPETLVYDQDKVFMVNENLGDYILTNEFESYIKSLGVRLWFCRKADPESKGKVENVVHFVKANFLRGRCFTTIENLNDEVIQWLERTGNGHVHAATRLVPAEEYEKEKRHLLPYNANLIEPAAKEKVYTIRKDNVISYHGNFYTVPKGSFNTYKYAVVTKIEEEGKPKIKICTQGGKVLTVHDIHSGKGQLIQKPDHMRDMESDVNELESLVLAKFGSSRLSILYISMLKSHTGRYYRDSLRVIANLKHNASVLNEALDICSGSSIYNANDFRDVANNVAKRKALPPVKMVEPVTSQAGLKDYSMNIERSSLSTYEEAMR